MGKEKNDANLFMERIEQLVEKPWENLDQIQDQLPTALDDKADFMFTRLFLPCFYIVIRLLKTRRSFLEYVLDDKENILPERHPLLSTHELYVAFRFFGSNADVLLEKVNSSSKVYTELKEALEGEDEEKFIEVIDKLNLTAITPLLNIIKIIENELPAFVNKVQQDNNLLDEESKKNKFQYQWETFMTEQLKYKPNDYVKEGSMATAKKTLAQMDIMGDSSWYSILYYRYCLWRNDGVLNEYDIKVLDYIFQQPAFENLYNENYQLWKDGLLEEKAKGFLDNMGVDVNEEDSKVFTKQERTIEGAPLSLKSKYGFIPEDYFSQRIDKEHPDDHYNLVDEIINAGEERFVEFVNYIANHQYIESNNETKALFAYRLSGRMRPKGKLEHIPWCGPNNSPDELLYIIRYCVDKGNHKKYSKMKVFFDGLVWPADGYSRIADDANTEFRKVLHDMYEICGLKYTQPKKKRNW